jgi:hypothetical protein
MLLQNLDASRINYARLAPCFRTARTVSANTPGYSAGDCSQSVNCLRDTSGKRIKCARHVEFLRHHQNLCTSATPLNLHNKL